MLVLGERLLDLLHLVAGDVLLANHDSIF